MPTFATMTRASSAYTCSTQELQSCQASTNPETSIAIQERPLYIGNLNRETSGDSKTRVSTLGRGFRFTRGPALPPPYCGAGAACHKQSQTVTDSAQGVPEVQFCLLHTAVLVLRVVKGEGSTEGHHQHHSGSPYICASGVIRLICAVLAVV